MGATFDHALKRMIAGAGLAMLALLPSGAAAAPKGDPAHGQQVFARCTACHTIGQAGGRIGPTLNGVVGRKAGTVPGYAYSTAMKASGRKWDATTLDHFLLAPMKAVPGTKMMFPGLPNAQDRADVVTYLKQYRADGSKK